MIGPATRKQVYELTLEDLDECPVWDFALDEEGREGQDEETVRPRLDHDGLAFAGDVVRAFFATADGRRLDGLVTAAPYDDWWTWFPQVFVGDRRIEFWHGYVWPDREILDTDVAALGGPTAFPIVATPAVPVDRPVPASIPIPAIMGLTRTGRRTAIAPRASSPGLVARALRRLRSLRRRD